MQDYIGRKITHYHITENLGMGGMAVVYKAYDTHLERDVALKMIRTDEIPASQHPRLMKRFDQEARAQSRFTHTNIVQVFDYGEFEGSPFLVLAYMPNGTLKERLSSALLAPMAMEILIPIADAVAYAHNMGVLHRDIKPSNIIFSQDNTPTLTDFGIAKVLETKEATLTGTGLGVGTPGYMAPEQWQGRATKASDQYSLGVVLYELLTGQKPYTAETPLAVALKQMSEPFPRPSELNPAISESLEKVLYKVLSREPLDRFENVKTFCRALEELLVAPEEGSDVVGETPQIIASKDGRISAPKPDSEAETIDKLEEGSLGLQNVNGTSVPHQQKAVTGSTRLTFPAWLLWLMVIVIGIGLLAGGIILFRGIGLTMLERGQEPQPMVLSTQPSDQPEPTTSDNSNLSPEQTKDEEKLSTITPVIEHASENGSSPVTLIDRAQIVYVPAGDFLMSSSHGNDGQDVNSDILVYLDGYWIYQHQVTNHAYRQCVESNACNKPKIMTDYDNPNLSNHPVVFVSLFDAIDYCTWAGGRLPTEKEWEKASRGTDGRLYPWGNDEPNCNLANYAGCEGGTKPVGSYIEGASPYGVLDMAGNVWEWIYFRVGEDDNDQWLDESSTNEMPPMGAPLPPKPMARGGSWSNQEMFLRISSREWFNPEYSGINLGFRCVLTETP
jgi:eukaryotic-like serine/threonine-protein kinase